MKNAVGVNKIKTQQSGTGLKGEVTIDIQTLLNKNSNFSRAMNLNSKQTSKSFRTPKVGASLNS